MLDDDDDDDNSDDDDSSDDDDDEQADEDENSYCGECFLYPEKKSIETLERRRKKKQTKRSTDEELKSKVFSTTFNDLAVLRCNPKECINAGNCLQKANIGLVYELRKDFWGLSEERAPSTKQRKKKIIEILNGAYCKNTEKFHFSVGPVKGTFLEVCEAAIAIILGLSKSPNKSEITNQWLTQRKLLINGKIDDIEEVRVKRYNSKTEKVSTYIEYMGNIFCETSPLAGFIVKFNIAKHVFIIIFINM
jgi:hypothetical protein